MLVKFRPGTTLSAAEVLAADLSMDRVREFRVLSQLRQRPMLLMSSARRSTRELLAALQADPQGGSRFPQLPPPPAAFAQ